MAFHQLSFTTASAFALGANPWPHDAKNNKRPKKQQENVLVMLRQAVQWQVWLSSPPSTLGYVCRAGGKGGREKGMAPCPAYSVAVSTLFRHRCQTLALTCPLHQSGLIFFPRDYLSIILFFLLPPHADTRFRTPTHS